MLSEEKERKKLRVYLVMKRALEIAIQAWLTKGKLKCKKRKVLSKKKGLVHSDSYKRNFTLFNNNKYFLDNFEKSERKFLIG